MENDKNINECYIITYHLFQQTLNYIWNINKNNFLGLNFKIIGPVPCKIFNYYETTGKLVTGCRVFSDKFFGRGKFNFGENVFLSKNEAVSYLNELIQIQIESLDKKISKLKSLQISFSE